MSQGAVDVRPLRALSTSRRNCARMKVLTALPTNSLASGLWPADQVPVGASARTRALEVCGAICAYAARASDTAVGTLWAKAPLLPAPPQAAIAGAARLAATVRSACLLSRK